MIRGIRFSRQSSNRNSFSLDVNHFLDSFQLIIGNYGLSPDQERAQMAIWSIMASPLIMSTDLRRLRPSSRAILTNTRLIAVNQDPLGHQGTVIKTVSIFHNPPYSTLQRIHWNEKR